MIANFPVPQKDELLSSVLARFVARQGLESHKVALDVLFGDRKVVTSALFQGRINLLLERVGHIWSTSEQEVVYQHTMLPLFAPFLPSNQVMKIIEDVSFKKGNTVSLRTGMNASLLNWRENYMFCPQCWESEKRELGFVYWHRSHQVPGVTYCSIHNCKLVDSEKSMQHTQRHAFVVPQIQQDKMLSCSEVKLNDREVLLSQSVSQLFELPSDSSMLAGISSDKWSAFYSNYAVQQGFLNGSRIDHKRIEQAIIAFWGKEWLKKNALFFEGDGSWLRRIFQKHRRGFSYLQHFVVWLAIEQKSIDVFERLSWVESIQKKVKKTKSTTTDRDVKEVRCMWLDLRRKQPEASLKMLRATQAGARLYTWLYRHDRAWLDENKPKKVANYVNSRVNWQERDDKLVRQLIVIMQSNEFELEGPRRSRSWYANKLGVKSLIEKHLDKLPRVSLFFSKYSETIEEYQCRRLARVLADLVLKSEQLIPICEVERYAGLSEQRKTTAARRIVSKSVPAWQISQIISK
ncbi:TnsD family Tn7-like transposition protein [Hydrogenovibrio marinus]|uniref:TnsD family Tn7-like transposition protein n=1 Tax=Hydrogenovibrio marinus TaxID=28885 RepID=UPI0004A78524|nr:TnsD family Tn7-like transposition protein [Hydrogenovibrio marinus]BBN58975.1 hypothetical protein HVMH_0569 [Hydrogenovibrio marinus]